LPGMGEAVGLHGAMTGAVPKAGNVVLRATMDLVYGRSLHSSRGFARHGHRNV
jgi:hypothetical protein